MYTAQKRGKIFVQHYILTFGEKYVIITEIHDIKPKRYLEFSMDKAKIDRINELGRIAKQRELTPAELEERKALREEYLAYVRSQLRGTGVDKK